MRFAYADPPYLGCCKLYDHYHPDGRCWDNPTTYRLLIARLNVKFPDGWALSASSPSLRTVLPMAPEDCRVGAWTKTFGAFKRGVRPAYMWEAVIYRRGRNPPWVSHPPPPKGGKQTTPKDFIACPIMLKKGLTGAKPEKFCVWVLDLLNVQSGDEVVDLFPGTGIMGQVAAKRVCP